MKLNKIAVFAFLSLLIFSACEDNNDDNEPAVTKITEPTTFTFNSRFVDGESSVSYSGQVVRNLLINDIKTQMGVDAGSKNSTTLLSMMANDDANREILSKGDLTTVQSKYHDISTSHLNDRLDAVESIVIPGYNATAKTLVSEWLTESSSNGQISSAGLDYAQMTQQ